MSLAINYVHRIGLNDLAAGRFLVLFRTFPRRNFPCFPKRKPGNPCVPVPAFSRRQVRGLPRLFRSRADGRVSVGNEKRKLCRVQSTRERVVLHNMKQTAFRLSLVLGLIAFNSPQAWANVTIT